MRHFYIIFFLAFCFHSPFSFANSSETLANTKPIKKSVKVRSGKGFVPPVGDAGYVNTTHSGFSFTVYKKQDGFTFSSLTKQPHNQKASCDQELPLLCIRKIDDMPKPSFVSGSYVWHPREAQITTPVRGNTLSSKQTMIQICKDQFGPEWTIATYHPLFEGLWAKGDVPLETQAWVNSDYYPGNCWNKFSKNPNKIKKSRLGRVNFDEKSIQSAGPITPNKIFESLNLNLDDIQYCYSRVVKRNTNLHGEISIAIKISNSTVTESKLLSSSIQNAPIETCIMGVLRRTPFPDHNKITDATINLILEKIVIE